MVRLLLVACFLLFSTLSCARPSPTSWETYSDTNGLSFRYPATFQPLPLTEEWAQTGFLVRLEQQDPPGLISLKQETKLGFLKVKGGSLQESLLEEINRRYPDRFPEYKKEKFDEVIVANEKSLLFEFTYLGTDQKTRMKQRLLVIPQTNKALLLSFQTKESDFLNLQPLFNEIMVSLHF